MPGFVDAKLPCSTTVSIKFLSVNQAIATISVLNFLCYFIGFQDSFIQSSPRLIDYLYAILIGSGHTWRPCYNARADGWEPEVFHNKCDHKPRTLFLARANSWWIFGGSSDRPWNACKNDQSGGRG